MTPARAGSFGVLLSLLLILGAPPAPAAEEIASRHALVIGNGAYRNLDAVAGAGEDARAVAAALRDLDFEVVEIVDGTNGQISAGLQTFVERLVPNAVVLFYYAGYIVPFEYRAFLVPVTADLRTEYAVLTEGIILDAVRNVIERSGAKAAVLMLDAMHRGDPPDRLALVPPKTANGAAASVTAYALRAPSDADDRSASLSRALVDGLREPEIELGDLLRRLKAPGEFVVSTIPDWEIPLRVEALSPTIVADPVPDTRPPVPDPQASTEAMPRPVVEPPPSEPPPVPTEPQASAERPADDRTTTPTEAAAEPSGEPELSWEERREIQRKLRAMGHYTAAIDGIIGPLSREAIRLYQRDIGAEQTGQLTASQIARLLSAAPTR